MQGRARQPWRSAAVAVGMSAAIVAITIPTGLSVQLTWFIPVMDALRAAAYTVVGVVAVLDVSTRRDPRLLPLVVVGVALAVLWVAHLLVFPGVVPGIAGRTETNATAWIFEVLAVLAPSLLAWSIVIRPHPFGDARRAVLIWVAAGAGIGLFGAGIGLLLGASALIPVTGNTFTVVNQVAVSVVLIPVAVAAVGVVRGRGDPRVVGAVIAALTFVATASVVDLFVTVRYTPTWYAHHFVLAFGPLALVAGVISLYARSVEAEIASMNMLVEANRKLDRGLVATEQARAEAEQANQAKAEFLSRMSHELRTPLSVILGHAQLLRVGADAELAADRILLAGNHLLGLTDDVLDVARIESGTFRISVEPVRLAPLMTECVELVEQLAGRAGVAIHVDEVRSDSWAMADDRRLRQVVTNILTNAVKYNVAGGSVSTSVRQAGSSLQIRVADTGVGMSPQQLSRLFTPFDRLGAEQGDVDGIGIGLALSRHLVESMGGRIEVASSPGSGSTFTVHLRSSDGHARPEQHDHGLTAGSLASEISSLGSATIAYIDDNRANTELAALVLRQVPTLSLITARCGREGLRLVDEMRPDLVILDVHLPDMRGDEVLLRLKEGSASRTVPTIVFTADATAPTRELFMGLGADRYLTKPMDVTAFLGAVRDVLRSRPRKGTARGGGSRTDDAAG